MIASTGLLRFRPFPFLASPDVQTIFAATTARSRGLPSQRRLVTLPDGDRLALEVTTPAGWAHDDETTVLIHGLCGCHESPYLVRMARRLAARGVRAVRLNLRGCGSGEGLARGIYHSGRSDDLLEVLRALRGEAPDAPISIVGYSLGGNIALKLAGELGEDGPRWIHRLIAVCPPADLAACSRLLGRRRNRLYDAYFTRLLVAAVRRRHAMFPDLGPVEFGRGLRLYSFDDVYTAPRAGFSGADEYYERSSAVRVASSIQAATYVLFAEDDPFIDCRAFEGLSLPDCVRVVTTERGGHVGFIGSPRRPGGVRWMDAVVDHWLGGGDAAA